MDVNGAFPPTWLEELCWSAPDYLLGGFGSLLLAYLFSYRKVAVRAPLVVLFPFPIFWGLVVGFRIVVILQYSAHLHSVSELS